MAASVETPYDLLQREEIELPDFVQFGGYNYRASTLAYLVRVWQYLYENSESIDLESYETTSDFETAHRDELLRLADGVGVSTVQAPMAQAHAVAIHEEGFEAWRTES